MDSLDKWGLLWIAITLPTLKPATSQRSTFTRDPAQPLRPPAYRDYRSIDAAITDTGNDLRQVASYPDRTRI